MQYLKTWAFNGEKVAVPLPFNFLVGFQDKMVALDRKGIHINIPNGYLYKTGWMKTTAFLPVYGKMAKSKHHIILWSDEYLGGW